MSVIDDLSGHLGESGIIVLGHRVAASVRALVRNSLRVTARHLNRTAAEDVYCSMNAADLCARLWPSVYRYVMGVTGDTALAEDIAQESLARVLARRDGFRGLNEPEHFVLRVATNLLRDHFRRAATRRRVRQVLSRSTDDGPERQVDTRAAILPHLRQLPQRQRLAVALRYGADVSTRDVARIMGVAEGTVKALCHQGIQRLRDDIPTSVMEG